MVEAARSATAGRAAGKIALISLLFAAASTQAQTARQSTIANPAQQITLAVLPAPKSMRDNATVLGYSQDGKLMTLRQGSGGLICLAPNPKETQFHVSCYHKSLELFMARSHGGKEPSVPQRRVHPIRDH